MEQASSNSALLAREKFVLAFNKTMIEIWQERITMLEVIDTGALLRSPVSLPVRADGRFFEVTLSQQFLEYGLWQDFGTGREKPRGNSGDIGHFTQGGSWGGSARKIRQRRPWFSKKYYSSVMKLKDFLADNIGHEFIGVMADVFQRTNKL